jgi:hypothetical protein
MAATNDLPADDPTLSHPDSLDADEWAAAFARADDQYGPLDLDAVSAWFAAALATGQSDPDGEILQS